MTPTCGQAIVSPVSAHRMADIRHFLAIAAARVRRSRGRFFSAAAAAHTLYQ